MPSKHSSRIPLKPEDLSAPFFSPVEAAWILKCSYDTVMRAIRSGRLGASQDEKGGAIRISREDLDAYYAGTRSGPPIRQNRRTRAAA